MRVEEAKAALERAGYVVAMAEATAASIGLLFNVEGLALDRQRGHDHRLDCCGISEAELIKLAHRHGRWPPAFERAHRAGP
jgi:hypothetical protein